MTCNNPKILSHYPTILDRGNEDFREIRIKKGGCQKYLLFPQHDGVYERHFILEEGAIFRGAGIAIGANMVLKMSVSIEGSGSEASLMILGLAKEDSLIEIDGVGKVLQGCENVKLRVDQTNILLAKNARVRGRPVLEVATDSIEGGHSCRIHQISPDTLFYLESRGIDASTAEGMLLEGEINRHVDIIGEAGEGVKEEILGMIRKTNV